MHYDLEKYRVKRERVLGRKRSFPTMRHISMLFAVTVVCVVSVIVIPQAIAFLQERHLADAIYRQVDNLPWDEHLVQELQGLQGVKTVAIDTRTNRMVVTFNATALSVDRINSAMSASEDIRPVLLNVLGHRQRMETMAKEAAFEAL